MHSLEGHERITLGKMLHPVRGILHGAAAVVSAVGLGFLIAGAHGDGGRLAGVIVFGASLIAMYTVSSLYHSVPWTERIKARLQRVDHSMIYLVVAGTTTPMAIATLDGWALVAILALVWGIAATGIILKFALRSPVTWLSVTLQVVMGWSCVLWFPALLDAYGWQGAWPVVAGGFAYMVGVVLYATQRPRLFPRIFSAHELFHVLVVTASSLHFVGILRVVAG